MHMAVQILKKKSTQMQRQLFKNAGKMGAKGRHQLKVMNKMISFSHLCLLPVCTALEACNYFLLVCLSTI